MKNYNLLSEGVISNKEIDQTKIIQSIFDKCRSSGGKIIFPQGEYLFSSIYVYSGTTIYLEKGARLFGSRNIDDYILFPIPKGMELHCDMQMIPEYYKNREIRNYRKAMFTAYNEHDISIVGEEDSIINGQNCVDLDGEEGYRGPHGIFFSNCYNLSFENFLISDCGNFAFQLDTSKNIVARKIHAVAGSDGFHLHECKNILFEDCNFETGDDCIAGINIENLHVNRCTFNTSCDVFRMGGNNILVENSYVYGPGKYPHRKTIFVDKDHFLPISEGRHNTICLLIYFASIAHPATKDSDNIIFKNVKVENVDMFLVYNPNCDDLKYLQNGNDLVGISLDNVHFTGLKACSNFDNKGHKPMTLYLHDVSSNIPFFKDLDNIIIKKF